ncbi:hypothetical protein QJS04_geneDACA004335 [Acorus gramineus]|uniref:Uncharacterized protein n=1 Tax=Acorus gramineus TaxID=55184 RepID=A0AAV9B3G7_ACOGR|nr:hypothetical protein QJS04_geneDACA004335 [Acorus gramineus]
MGSSKFLNLVVLISILGNGVQAICDLQSIEINQTTTGETVEGMPQYEVEIKNSCICTQLDVTLDCAGFITVQPIEPAIIRMDGEKCIVKDGLPIHFNDVIKFNYAWDSTFVFVPISSQIACS